MSTTVGRKTAHGELPLCPLCGTRGTDPYHEPGKGRSYARCLRCALVHMQPAHRLSIEDESKRYLLHQNDHADTEYVRFLRRLADPVMDRLPAGARGLDFGCGPAPVLSELLTSAGYPCAAYDPFFAPDDALLEGSYDFITCSEVVEHAHDPAEMFATLHRMLAPGGLLGVMTRFYPDDIPFADWWYRRDPTHVCFYNELTMRWIGERFGLGTDFPRSDVTLFTANAARGP